MPKAVIVGDPGSCWMGRRDFAEKLVKVGKEAGLDCVKFQLFRGEEFTQNGNIEMPYDLFKDLYQYGKEVGIPVTASVFDAQSLEFLMGLELHHIKFGYSQRLKTDWIKGALSVGRRVVVTTNIHDSFELPKDENLIKLMTQPRCKHADEYAITTKTHFEGLFPDRFQGFSDHSLGYMEAQLAVSHGAKWIEKHFMLNDIQCLDVPDGKFALDEEELAEFCWKIQ